MTSYGYRRRGRAVDTPLNTEKGSLTSRNANVRNGEAVASLRYIKDG